VASRVRNQAWECLRTELTRVELQEPHLRAEPLDPPDKDLELHVVYDPMHEREDNGRDLW
jgi:hypothetical protein